MTEFYKFKQGDKIRLLGKPSPFVRHVSPGEAQALACTRPCPICEAMPEIKMYYLVRFRKDVWRRPVVASGEAVADGVTNDVLVHLKGDRRIVTDLYRADLDEMGAEYEVLGSATKEEHRAIVIAEAKRRGLEV